MDAVIKVGGSLSEEPTVLKCLCNELSLLAKDFQVTIVPGGGRFADAVREFDAKYCLAPVISHKMAILAMDQYGLLLSHLMPNAKYCASLQEAKIISAQGDLPVLLPSKLLFASDPFEPSWDVTSDSIAAYIATCLAAKRLLLVTNVDGIFSENPKQNQNAKLLTEISSTQLQAFPNRTSVDRFLPRFLQSHPIDCYVVNGNFPERIRCILTGKNAVATKIVL